MPRSQLGPRPVDLIDAPSNLGLRPDAHGDIPQTWAAPAAYQRFGLADRLAVRHHIALARPKYSLERQPGTQLRNGCTLRTWNEELATKVCRSLKDGGFPLVVGGDCSNLVGAMLGLRRAGGRGLVHLDGHSDFLQPEFYPAAYPLHSAAGMDLALVTGRGEDMLAKWPDVVGPLVEDGDVFQLGEREAGPGRSRSPYLAGTDIAQIVVQDALKLGMAECAQRVQDHLARRSIDRAWLHVDVDIMDESVLPAVDSPGEPGLDLAGLAELIGRLIDTRRIVGADIAIYDPGLDPNLIYAPKLVDLMVAAFGRT